MTLCKLCGNEFRADNNIEAHKNGYCSERCFYKAHMKCTLCGKEYLYDRTQKAHRRGMCSLKCYKDNMDKVGQKQTKERLEHFREAESYHWGMSFEDWCKANGEYGAKLLREYSARNTVSPSKIKAKSTEKAKFICSKCGKENETSIVYMTSALRECPYCGTKRKSKISYTEAAMLYVLRRQLGRENVLSKAKVGNEVVDIYIPKYNIAIGYAADIYRANMQKRDNEIRKEMKRNGVDYIEVLHRSHKNEGEKRDINVLGDNSRSVDLALTLLRRKLYDMRDIKLDTELSISEKDKIESKTRASGIDIDKYFTLHCMGFSTDQAAELLGVKKSELGSKMRHLDRDDRKQIERMVNSLIALTSCGHDPEYIMKSPLCSRYKLNINIVKKVQDIYKRYLPELNNMMTARREKEAAELAFI